MNNLLYLEEYCTKLINKYPKYSNYINNYYKIIKYKYFEDKHLDYKSIPDDSSTNNFLECYNNYIKS